MGTENIKLGVCYVSFDGNDLGLTKGGVEVEVTTDTHVVMVDQYGESEVNEYIQKRSIKVKCPLAETTVENMVKIMPGATLVDGSSKEVQAVNWTSPTTGTHVINIDGQDYSFTDDGTPTEAELIAGFVTAINDNPRAPCVASDGTTELVLTAKIGGTEGQFTVDATGTTNGVVSTTTAAIDGKKRVDVDNGIGTDLLTIAKQLVLQPKGLDYTDKSEDFVVPLAATAGAVQFAYKFDDERVYNVEFTGYPNSTTDLLFSFGDPTA